MNVTEFWRDNADLAYMTPRDDRWPEGYDVFGAFAQLMPTGVVLDFGCGDGRMTPAFSADRYIGVDISPHAVDHCRALYPEHQFERAMEKLPQADVVLCYTTLLHVPDDEIAWVVPRLAIAAPRVIVVEILGRHWRGPGLPPVFNRDLADYVDEFSAVGMYLEDATGRTYNRYGGVEITFIDFRRYPVTETSGLDDYDRLR